MDQTTLIIIAIAGLAAVCIVAVGFAFTSGKNAKSSQRMTRVAAGGARRSRADEKSEGAVDNSGPRRKQVQETLKKLEEKQQREKEKLTLSLRLERAGLDVTARAFYIASGFTGLLVAIIVILAGFSPLIALLAGFAGGFGVPRWVVNFFTNRRQKAFIEEFANSLDVIVRGVKAGLPINDCLKIISVESAEPVRTEFRNLVEGQKIGVTIEQGLQKAYERMPLAEVNFFMIVLAIQQKSGGNLSEALGNLSKVLRDRKKMRAKIQAMSQEAKASAGIIGSLPPAVMGMIYLISPEYIDLLFSTTMGNMIIVGSLMWMGIGVLVMRKMINFNF